MPILYIRDKDGIFKTIRALKGNDGKSAYEQAKEGGYTGTEESFIALLNGLSNDTEAGELLLKLEEHTTDVTQHIVTNAHGGISVAGGNVSDKSIAIGGGCTASGTGVALGDYADSKGGGAVGPDAKTKLGGSVGQVAISDSGFAGGEFATTTNGGAVGQYACAGNGFAGGKSAWTKTENHAPIDAIQLGEGWNTSEKTLQVYDYQLMDANGLIPSARLPIYHGSYQGVGGYGSNNPNSITFPFKPKCVVISHPSSITVGSNLNYYVTLPLVYGCSLGFVSLSSSAREAPYNIPLALTWNGNTLSWYYTKTDNNGVYYQLNSPTETYNYVAW